MKATIEIAGKSYQIDLSKPFDISIPLSDSDKNPIAWYLNKPEISPVKVGDWIGKVSEGKSSTNFNNIYFNPHGHGTHTECLGHITKDFYSVQDSLKTYFFLAQLISVLPENHQNDSIITKGQIEKQLNFGVEAVIIRTLPNPNSKKSINYSHTNPPYLHHEAAEFLREKGVKHLLIDLPSVDREEDEGKLLAHKAFWNVMNIQNLNEDARLDATITELIYVADEIIDGMFMLNLQIASFVNDATPSKPVLYKISDL